jgi:hypothetical protein
MRIYPLVFTTGYRFTGFNLDAFAVKLDETPSLVFHSTP